MSYDQPEVLSVSVEAADEAHTAGAWAIHRAPDQMLLVRSRPEYAEHEQALEAARIAARRVSRKLSIPFAINKPGHGDRIVTTHDVRGAPD